MNCIPIFVFIISLILPDLARAVIVHSQEIHSNLYFIDTTSRQINTIDEEEKIGITLTPKETVAIKSVKAKSKKIAHQTTVQSKKTDVFAIAGFSTGISGMLILIFYGSFSLFLATLFGSLAVALSIVGLIRITQKTASRKGKALAIIGLLFGGAVAIAGLIIGFGRLI